MVHQKKKHKSDIHNPAEKSLPFEKKINSQDSLKQQKTQNSNQKTLVWNVSKHITFGEKPSPQLISAVSEAAALLKKDEVVAFPTETVYGLGGNGLSKVAVERIFGAKGRPSDNPLILHVASVQQFYDLIDPSIPPCPLTNILIKSFWPGPLTIIRPKNKIVPDCVTGGLGTVAVRMPDHPAALALIQTANFPIAAPSANTSGRPSPTTAQHVMADLEGKIAGVVDGGNTGIGVESTVVECTQANGSEKGRCVILRKGGLTFEQIENVLGKGNVINDPALDSDVLRPKAPGMKYKHYAPRASLCLVEGSDEWITSLILRAQKNGKKVGYLTTKENLQSSPVRAVGLRYTITCGYRSDIASVAKELFASLRSFDSTDADLIYCKTFPTIGLGQAIMDRLHKAAGKTPILKEKDQNKTNNQCNTNQ